MAGFLKWLGVPQLQNQWAIEPPKPGRSIVSDAHKNTALAALPRPNRGILQCVLGRIELHDVIAARIF
jgi:hypothetical protein